MGPKTQRISKSMTCQESPMWIAWATAKSWHRCVWWQACAWVQWGAFEIPWCELNKYYWCVQEHTAWLPHPQCACTYARAHRHTHMVLLGPSWFGWTPDHPFSSFALGLGSFGPYNLTMVSNCALTERLGTTCYFSTLVTQLSNGNNHE